MTEAAATAALTDIMRRMGAVVYPAVGGPGRPAGWPDRWVAWQGWSGWLEIKTGEGRLSPLQRWTLLAIRAAGASAWVVRIRIGRTIDLEGPDGETAAKRIHWGRLLPELLRIDAAATPQKGRKR